MAHTQIILVMLSSSSFAYESSPGVVQDEADQGKCKGDQNDLFQAAENTEEICQSNTLKVIGTGVGFCCVSFLEKLEPSVKL
ncbi:unnamed protein product [Ilex paraguariensis]|uniref:Uncharacterized protein n=1 Tax=Ilex paraguariensis TaxID=185542 RepID=A0ABC8V2V5_9AQUA